MGSQASEIDWAEFVKSIEPARITTDGGWLTITEIADATGLGKNRARDMVRKALLQGRMETQSCIIVNMANRRHAVPKYRVCPKAGGKKKA